MSKVREAISAVRKALDELDKALEYEQSGMYEDDDGCLRWTDTDQPVESQLWNDI